MTLTKLTLTVAAGLLTAACATSPEPPKYPVQPVKVVIPYPAGNAADIVGRALVDKLAQMWGQPITVENRGGPTTVPGVDSVAKSRPDGYTLLLHSVSYAVDAGLYTGLPYDATRDFTPLAGIARQPFALVASPTLGVRSVADLTAKARAGALKFGSLGPTTQVYFVAEQFRRTAGFNAGHQSYRSLAEANGATARGDVAFWFPAVAGALAGVRDAGLVPLAVTGEQRSPMMAQVPTMAEAGVPGLVSYAWFGLWAPAGLPAGLSDKISADVGRALASPDLRERFAKLGAEPMPMTVSQFGRFVRKETDDSRRFVGELGIRPQAYVPAKP